jgi:hypothetical protein
MAMRITGVTILATGQIVAMSNTGINRSFLIGHCASQRFWGSDDSGPISKVQYSSV